ncbi:MAG: response regulator transcription factor [Candidatus Eremiobacteraeota bacterium]|nr:response regulator transcription factor [Candidatus Eremiobacteraeota bacterium]MCW5871615.1 response regulator transcription factor [Candidatus Eremiobacteraeota bacterium]
MHLTEFHVLLVDDEPDVHEISRLAMRQFRVFGLPIRLHSATSKDEAIQLLESLRLGPGFSLASVALIDVVMETEHAGLELCEYIRDVMKNRTLQIHVRTGQPGLAPERSVLDRYDIQGYLAKAEATADKLYTLVKAGVREHYFTGLSHGLQDILDYLIPSASTRSGIAESLRAFERLARVHRSGGDKAETIKAPLCYILEGEFVTGLEDWSESCPALARRDELLALPAQKLNDDGDCYTIDGRDLLIQIAPTATKAALHYMLRSTVAPPDWEVFLYHRYLRTFSALWKQAR